jgi:HSP90 family molecular chaperone
MGKKLVWFETYTTICKYSAKLTDEQAKLFEEDEEKFYDEVEFRADQELEWDKIKNEEESDFQIEEE